MMTSSHHDIRLTDWARGWLSGGAEEVKSWQWDLYLKSHRRGSSGVCVCWVVCMGYKFQYTQLWGRKSEWVVVCVWVVWVGCVVLCNHNSNITTNEKEQDGGHDDYVPPRAGPLWLNPIHLVEVRRVGSPDLGYAPYKRECWLDLWKLIPRQVQVRWEGLRTTTYFHPSSWSRRSRPALSSPPWRWPRAGRWTHTDRVVWWWTIWCMAYSLKTFWNDLNIKLIDRLIIDFWPYRSKLFFPQSLFKNNTLESDEWGKTRLAVLVMAFFGLPSGTLFTENCFVTLLLSLEILNLKSWASSWVSSCGCAWLVKRFPLIYPLRAVPPRYPSSTHLPVYPSLQHHH